MVNKFKTLEEVRSNKNKSGQKEKLYKMLEEYLWYVGYTAKDFKDFEKKWLLTATQMEEFFDERVERDPSRELEIKEILNTIQQIPSNDIKNSISSYVGKMEGIETIKDKRWDEIMHTLSYIHKKNILKEDISATAKKNIIHHLMDNPSTKKYFETDKLVDDENVDELYDMLIKNNKNIKHSIQEELFEYTPNGSTNDPVLFF